MHNPMIQQAVHVPMTMTLSGNKATYNLGNYFPRVASEPPTRKSYNNANSFGSRDAKVPREKTTPSAHFVKVQRYPRGGLLP